MNSRRQFLKTATQSALVLGLGGFSSLETFAARDYHKLTILHTNDVHSRIEPFSSGRYKGLGGAARRALLLQKIRKEEEQVLLLDCGDIFQGTPYFNFFNGELDFKLMNAMRYDAATIGNHDFDGGMEALRKQAKTASFPLLNVNYNFANTLMDGYVKPYQIFKKGKIKVGVFGVGIELEGLVPAKLYGKTSYEDPLAIATKTAQHLKEKEKCHLVICLSHLGFKYESDIISDEVLAKKSSYIDVILGGHTHTFLDEPAIYKNVDGEEVVVNQVGWAGIVLGRLDVYFRKDFRKRKLSGKPIEVK